MTKDTLNEIIIKKQITVQTSLLNVPPLYQGATFKDVKIYSEICPDHQKETLTRIKNYALNFRKNLKAHKNAIFLGNFGNGKTMLAFIIAQSIINQGFKVKLQKFDDIISDKRKLWGMPEAVQANFLKDFSIPDLLIIDEFGKDKITDDEHKTLSKIFDWRYEHRKPILLIANKTQEDLGEILGPRLWSRLEENDPELFVFAWEDFRPMKARFLK
jgi:DNA replication protein DnaC